MTHKPRTHHRYHPALPPLKLVSLAVLALANSVPMAWAQVTNATSDTLQMSPLGFSGAINTPTADVMPMGSTAFAVTNSIPERARRFPGIGVFGGMNLGFGLFPGLELVGRLTYDGNVQCNEFDKVNCPTTARDLSLSGKYQLPFTLPYATRMAVGFTDYGGNAAVNYRQIYGVATSSHGPFDLSLGYSTKSSATALMHGTFGNLTARVNDQLALVIESDTQAKRIGAHYTHPVASDLDVQLGLSRKLSGPASQQTNQFTATLRYYFDKKAMTRSRLKRPAWGDGSAGDKAKAVSQNAGEPGSVQARSQALADRLAAHGFANIQITTLPVADNRPVLWWVQAEPVGWRKSHADGLGAGLVEWMKGHEADDAEVVFTLTHMGQPTTSVHTSRECLDGFAKGNDQCAGALALRFFQGGSLPGRLLQAQSGELAPSVAAANPYQWKPQIELGVNVRSTVGTEYGLADYSLAADVGAQAQLGKGLFWQGNVLLPLSKSGDFEQGGVYHLLGHPKAEVDQALLSYWRYVDTPWLKNVAVQASAGAINSYSRGGQVDAVWMNPAGNWRVGALAGVYSRSTSTGARKTQTPALVSLRHSVIPGQWQLEGMAGKFLGGDTGYKAMSHHWFGDYRLSFYIRESKGSAATMPKTRFAGFEFSVPLGPKASTDLGWGTVRGQDRWDWGLATKIGQNNNRLTIGYGEVPMPRHGIWTDATDHDRSGALDMWGNRAHLRGALQQTSDQTPLKTGANPEK